MISLIVAMSENHVIGVDNKLPWHIPEDLKRFKKLTLGHPMIMGRKTFDSIGKPLPGRSSIVITRNREWKHEGVLVTHSLKEAIANAKKQPGGEEIFIIGGGEIFKEALPLANKLYLTIVHEVIQGDAYFPEFSKANYAIELEEKTLGSPACTYINLKKLD